MSEQNRGGSAGGRELEVARISVNIPRLLAQYRKEKHPRTNLRLALREGVQNAVDATLGLADDAVRDIELAIDGQDLVLRDHGVGMTPGDFNEKVLRLFGSGKGEGQFGGFGVGTLAILQGSPEVRIRTRTVDGPGAELSTEWINERPPRIMDPSEADAFGHGTEIRFVGLLGQKLAWGELDASDVKSEVDQLFATSQFPHNVRLRYNGQEVRSLVRLDASSRRIDGESITDFAGCELDHHVVPNEGPGAPLHLVHLADPRGRGWSLTQWSRYLDSGCDFHVVTVVRPKVGVDHPDYPFTDDRNAFAVREVEDAAYRERRRHEIDREAALKEHTYRRNFYRGAGDEPETVRDPIVSAILDEARSRRNQERQRRMLEALSGAVHFEVTPSIPEASRTSRPERSGEVSPFGEALTARPTMVAVHKDWRRPDWMPESFDPHSPKSIRELVPVLLAMQQFGDIIRNEAAKLDLHTYGPEAPDIHFGFVFSPEADGIMEVADAPDGSSMRFVLINPCSERFRRARFPEAMADVLTLLVQHELTHVADSRKAHYDSFIYFRENLDTEIANLRPILRAVAESTDLFPTLRAFHGLPQRPGRVRLGGSGSLRPQTDDWAQHYPGLGEDARSVLFRIAEFSRGATNRLMAAEAVAELLGMLEDCHLFVGEEMNALAAACREAGVTGSRSVEDVLADGMAERGEEAARFQIDIMRVLRREWEFQRVATLLTDGYISEYDFLEIFSRSHISPLVLYALYHRADQGRYNSYGYEALARAIENAGDGRPIKSAIREARQVVVGQNDAGTAHLRGLAGEAAVLLGVLIGTPSPAAYEAGLDPYADCRAALKEFVKSGEMPRSVSIRTPAQERRRSRGRSL